MRSNSRSSTCFNKACDGLGRMFDHFDRGNVVAKIVVMFKSDVAYSIDAVTNESGDSALRVVSLKVS